MSKDPKLPSCFLEHLQKEIVVKEANAAGNDFLADWGIDEEIDTF